MVGRHRPLRFAQPARERQWLRLSALVDDVEAFFVLRQSCTMLPIFHAHLCKATKMLKKGEVQRSSSALWDHRFEVLAIFPLQGHVYGAPKVLDIVLMSCHSKQYSSSGKKWCQGSRSKRHVPTVDGRPFLKIQSTLLTA